MVAPLEQDRRIFAIEWPQHGRNRLAVCYFVVEHIDKHFNAENISKQDEFVARVVGNVTCSHQELAPGNHFRVAQPHFLAEVMQVPDQTGADLLVPLGHTRRGCRDDDLGDGLDGDVSHLGSSAALMAPLR